ncbi:hypothetical protein YPPY88_1148, partial [Yersinia pestis PY-88]
MWCGWGGG